LLEAELFGHVRGAFTGAVGTRQGRVEQAHKGTLFLDEVGTMSPALQAKLLRVLQEREFERVGDSHTIRIDVRVIAATHSDLTRMVADGAFREDLYYRLNVLPVQLPPLRERREDVPLLVQHFMQRLTAESGRDPMTVSQEAMRRLMAFRWPGNVRQLENVVERAIAFSQGRSHLDVQDLPPEIQNHAGLIEDADTWLPDDGIDLARYIEGVELALIKRSLERTHGNKRQAAQLLNLKRTTLVEKLKRLEPHLASD
jgi:transcriptional regulator with PAS, ATPase and Fis domain